MKQSSEQSYLYGNHVMKSGLGRITENTPQHMGVVIYSMNDIPLVGNSIFQHYTVFELVILINSLSAEIKFNPYEVIVNFLFD